MDPNAQLKFLPSKRHLAAQGYKPELIEHSTNHFVAEHDSIEVLLAAVNGY
jgi:hypothetical protein